MVVLEFGVMRKKHLKPNRSARPWVTASVMAPAVSPRSYVVGLHHGHGWVFPGGRVAPFESLRDAAAREFREETGYKVLIGIQLRTFEIIDEKTDHHSIMVVFLGNVVGARHRPESKGDISQVAHMTFEELEYDNRTAANTLSIIAWCKSRQVS